MRLGPTAGEGDPAAPALHLSQTSSTVLVVFFLLNHLTLSYTNGLALFYFYF